MNATKHTPGIWRRLFALLPKTQKLEFLAVLAILALSAVLSQLTPLAIGYLTDHVLAAQSATFQSVLPILLVIPLVNVVNEVIKVIRRLIVEDAATQAEKNARQQAALSLLLAPLSYFRGHMTGNIHGRLNRSLEGTVKLIKLLFMDFAPAVSTGLAAIVTIFWQLPFPVACLVILVIPVGTFIVFRQISTQKGIRVELMDTKAEMDGTMVELLGGIETIRALDSARAESSRIEAQSEQLRRKEMRHHKAMALYDCLKFVNEAFFSVLVIGLSVLLASQGIITIGTVLTAYLCFTQLTGPLRELHRILDEFSECVVLAGDYFPAAGTAVGFLVPDRSGRSPGPAREQPGGVVRCALLLPGKTGPAGTERHRPGDRHRTVHRHRRPQRLRQIQPDQGAGQTGTGRRDHHPGRGAAGGPHPSGSGGKCSPGPPDALLDCRHGLPQYLLRADPPGPAGGSTGGRPQGQHCRRY